MYKLLGANLILTLPGYFYIHFIIFIYLGSALIFINNGAQNYLYIISTHLVLIILPMGIALTNKLLILNYPMVLNTYLGKPIIDKQSGNQFNILYLIVLCISIAVALVYFYRLEIIPINYLITSLSDKLDFIELAQLREAATTTFKFGKLHRYRFFIAQMIPLLVIIAFIKSKLSNSNLWRFQFYLLTIFAIYGSIADLQKAPLIHLIILIFLASWIFQGKINLKNVGILISLIFIILSLMYNYIIGVNQGSLSDILIRIGNRILLTQTNALYYYFSLFPSSHDFLYGASLPNPAGIFQFEHFPITKWIFINGFNRHNWEVVGTAPSAFIGEIYSNFGFLIMVLSILFFSMMLQFIQIKFTSKPRTLLYTAFYTYVVFLSGKFAFTGLFNVVHIYLFIFLFSTLFMTDGYRVLVGAINSEK